MRSRARSAAAPVLAVVLALAAGACSSTSKQVTVEIQQRLQQRLDLPDRPPTSCPAGMRGKKGETFTCVVTIDGQKLDAHVAFTRDNNFDLSFDGTVPTATQLAAKLKSDTTSASADCGRKPLLVITPKTSVVCTVKGADGASVRIQVGFVDGKLAYQPLDG